MKRPTPPPAPSTKAPDPAASGRSAKKKSAKTATAKAPTPGSASARAASARPASPKKTSASAAAASGSSAPRPSGRRVDVRGWLGGVRVSGFVVIMLGLVVLGTFVLVPTVGTYMDQRQQIQALESAVALSQSEVADLQTQRERWSDPAYITTQARERLYYTMPGEVVYLIDDDLPASAALQEQGDVSDDVQQTRSDWMAQLVRSVTAAGAAQVAVPTIGVPDPTPAPDATPAP